MPRGLAVVAVAALLWANPARADDDALARLTAQSDQDYDNGRYADGVAVSEQVVTLTKERYGEQDPRYAAALNGLATFLQFTGALDRAESTLRQALAIDIAALGPSAPDVAVRKSNLALVLLDEGHPAEAADLLNGVLAMAAQQGATPEQYGTGLANFGAALERLNRPQDAERLYLAAIAAFRRQPEASAVRLASTLGNLGILYKTQKRFGEARPLLEEAVAILERLSTPDAPNPRLASQLNNLGTLDEDEGDFEKAEPLYKRALEIDRTMFGPDNPRLAVRLANLAGMYVTQGRLAEAAPALKEAMRIDRAAYGDDDPHVAQLFLGGARLLAARKDWEHAHQLIGRAVEIMSEADARRTTETRGGIEAGRDIPDVSLSQIVYETALQIDGEWPWSDTSQFGKLGGDAFDVAQRLVTPAAAVAILRMAQRYASGDPAIADKVRQQQDVIRQWNTAETQIVSMLGLPDDRIDRAALAAARDAQADAARRIQSLNAELRRGSAGFAELSGTRGLTIAEVQALLTGDEALVYFADDRVHIHAFFITKDRAAWMPLAFGAQTIADEVAALRCGLDATAWLDERAERCHKLLQINYTEADLAADEPLPFDLARAHQLYDHLFAKLGPMVAGKRLIVVPTGALATLPLQVLVTAAPDPTLTGDEAYRRAAWLIRQQPITVLPSVASLAALRKGIPKERAPLGFLGIGDPLLDGPPEAADLAREARAKQDCAAPLKRRIAAAALSPEEMRGAPLNADDVRQLMPLPDTADELCDVAAALHAPAADVLLGTTATKGAVLALSRSGRLAGFAVIHFATHGLVSDEIAGLTEPALVLTPGPGDASGDDGLLTTSDVAGLKIGADWVVLSACNSAAGSVGDNETFSGLARAFFFAGARAVLVSHWPVVSAAAVSLTTGAYRALDTAPGIGRAEALRRSMLALLNAGGVASRPAYWAPFANVGDGN